jgi:hypothetical protein
LAKSYKVVTGKVRFSYVNVFAPVGQDDGKPPKYSVALIIPKSDEDTIASINLAVSDCKQDNLDVWGGYIPEDLKGGLRDGDLEKNDPAYDGCMFINATSTARPGVVDENLQDITRPSEFYSGCYGVAAITFYPYNNGEKLQGIGCTINNLMKTDDGERLGGFSTPIEDFASFIKKKSKMK